MPEVSYGHATGYANLSSYNLEWNQGAGTAFYELSGGTTESLTQKILTTLVTAGQSYTFRYRIKNLFGFSTSYSPEASILAAQRPSAPTAAVVSLVGVNVNISWTQPATNGASLISYAIQIADVNGTWRQDTTYCDGADSGVKANAKCAIPMSVLRDTAGAFKLPRSTLILARVAASNILGFGTYSSNNTVGGSIQTLPAAPVGLVSGSGTSSTIVEVTWSPLTTEEELGGLTSVVVITSYSLYWDMGTGADPFVELVGYSAPYTASSFTTDPSVPQQSVAEGTTYRFKVRAQNAQGWGPFSGTTSVLAASEPSQAAMVIVTDNAGLPSVRITWSAPAENGSPITAYEIKIRTSNSAVYATTADCDGSASAVAAARYCDVLMATLVGAPFSLTQGGAVIATVRAANVVGWSTSASPPNAGMAVTIKTIPPAPVSAVYADQQDKFVLIVAMPSIEANQTGGSNITSYNLKYDQGNTNNQSFVSLIGEILIVTIGFSIYCTLYLRVSSS